MVTTYNEFKEFINKLDNKPKLLLHVCCAPCSSHTLKLLLDYFEITVFYSNDNIYPKEEFDNRYDELLRLKKEADFNITTVKDTYDYDRFLNSIKGSEELGERSIRCYKCYKLRMERTAKYAKENNFEYFTTSLSISPHKVTSWINEIGYNLQDKYQIKYLYSDFKKENGYKESIELSKKYNLYRQDYCGCKYSKIERENFKK